ncbi:peptidoglycan DD-metalloendopeptidase family protein [Gordonia rubripertincta]|uniref:Peptidoglycan DD-metalloendopeptidase family protein n=1 Tax=Gordonia rubripertincta TaxID=36822 RepID=A0ABT4N335_GORRU|nr:peptidoglycan DD-metalloendopeptidase family protein [Gordonia rubripertincta]MCZ4553637.1 peptidoglycan DD-metalloendopeptidase family protein [Gordonia rubripertincta]
MASSAGTSKKLSLAGGVGLLIVIIGFFGFGSDDNPPPTDCLPQVATSGPTLAGPGSKVMPLKTGTYQLSSPFGPRWGTQHQGSDFSAPLGTPIYAAMGGTVAKAETAQGFGHWIIIDFDDGGKKFSNVYGHMTGASLKVRTGDQVSAGQEIAAVGNEGESTGPHLHFELWDGTRLGGGQAVDPMPWLSGAGEPGQPTSDPSADTAAPRGPPAGTDVDAAPAPSDPSVVSVADWEKVAKLESGGDWAIDTGNGYQGGLQFAPSTWTGHGGAEFAPTANKATPQQQMEVANRVLIGQGWNAWPTTSKEAAVTDKKPAPAGTFLSGAVSEPKVELAAAVTPGAGCVLPGAGGGAVLKPGSVPPEYEPWIIKAAQTCPEVTAPLLAAQLENEGGGFNPKAYNADSRAMGNAQFIPSVWPEKGVDGDGNGTKDPYTVPDAVMSMASFDCELVGIAKKGLQDGSLQGDLTELYLSMYNCGPGATASQGGVCQNTQTQNYVRNIPANAIAKFSAPDPGGTADLALSGPFGKKAVDAAMRWRGTTYAWGGGTANGPSKGIADGGVADSFGDFNKIGFDCSGLMIYAIAQASDHKIILDHYTVRQLNDPRGKPVPINALQPGDVVFPGGGNPQHVAMYIGGGQMIEAPQSGDVVKVSPLSNLGGGIDARRFG